MTNLAPTGFLSIGTASLEYKWLAPLVPDAPTIVMLHEGLGSVGLWNDFPEKLQQATGTGIFVYSRAGYGQSSPVALPRPLDYMQREALDVLPKVLDAIGFKRGLLLGHSDGGSIAAIYAGAHQDHRLQGIALIAPHFIVEDISVTSIAAIKTTYETTDLKPKLARWHKDVDNAFYGWNGALPIQNSETGTSPNTSPISASPSWSCKAWTTNMALCVRSRLRGRNVTAQSTWKSFQARGIPRIVTRPQRRLTRSSNSQGRLCATIKGCRDAPRELAAVPIFMKQSAYRIR